MTQWNMAKVRASLAAHKYDLAAWSSLNKGGYRWLLRNGHLQAVRDLCAEPSRVLFIAEARESTRPYGTYREWYAERFDMYCRVYRAGLIPQVWERVGQVQRYKEKVPGLVMGDEGAFHDDVGGDI